MAIGHCGSFATSRGGQLLLGLERADLDPGHGLAQIPRDVGDDLGVLVVGGRLHDGLGPRCGIGGLEDAGADKDPVHAELHHERRIGRRGDPAGGEVDHGESSGPGDLRHQLEGSAERLRLGHQLFLAHPLQLSDLAQDGPGVPDGLHDVPGARLALGADHGRPFAEASKRLAQVSAAADKRDREVVLPDVVLLVGRRQDFGLVDIVDSERLEHLGLDEVADPTLGHDRDGHRLLDLLDDRRIGHPGNAARRTDVRRDTFQRHDRAGSRVLGDLGVLRRHHVHDDPTLQHLGEADLHCPSSLFHAVCPPVTPWPKGPGELAHAIQSLSAETARYRQGSQSPRWRGRPSTRTENIARLLQGDDIHVTECHSGRICRSV